MEDMFRDSTRKSKKRKKKTKATLSFALDDEEVDVDELSREESFKERDENEDTPLTKRSRSHKNPDVDTSFLPDREREEAERRERERLRLEWLARQDTMKKEDIEITYSYWDGSGHRKSVMVSHLYSPTLPIATALLSSARKGTRLQISLKNVANSFQNCEASVSIT